MIGSVTEVQEQMAAIDKRRMDAARPQPAGEPAPEAAEVSPDSTDDMAGARMEPAGFQRGYVEDGHAAASPQAEPPRTNPMPQLVPGFPMAVALPGAAMAARVSQEIASTLCGGSPSER